MSVVAIVNPAAGRGQAAKTWMKVRAHLKGSVETLETERPGHASELAARAIKRGADTIVAVGGDGTINEVVNGFFEQDRLISDRAVLGIVPHGTGSDFIRALEMPQADVRVAALIQNRSSRPLDLLKVRYTNVKGTSASRYAVNIASFGMGGMVASLVNRSSKRFGRKLSFMLATVRAALTFQGDSISICFDNSKTIDTKITNVAVGNGQYHGAGMLACPRATIDDGFLDVTLVEFLPALQLVRSLPLLYNGAIYTHPKVHFYRVTCLLAESKQPVLIEIDGEPLGRLPIEISIVPKAIRILAP